MDKGKIKLCCGGRGCPTIWLDCDNIYIADDNGSTIKISRQEADLIPDALKQLQEGK